MQSSVYQIQSAALRPYVQYVLFNYATAQTSTRRVVSLPNHNFCLGIIKDQELYEDDCVLKLRKKKGLNTYLSGLYTKPHVFCTKGAFDEICIDFTLSGYHRFFSTPAATYQLSEDLLSPNFGPQAIAFFTQLFNLEDRFARGLGIEQFLLFSLSRQPRITPPHLRLFDQLSSICSVRSLAQQLQYSERKLQRLLAKELAISPKQLLRILRFRQLLLMINKKASLNINWEVLAYQSGYFDYSHLYKDFQQLAGSSPLEFLENKYEIDQTVTVCLA